MMKLKTIFEFKKKLAELDNLVKVLEEDFLDSLDDDLWTIDLGCRPYFTEDFDVEFVSETSLTNKYIARFSEDFGLKLKDYQKTFDGHRYLFTVDMEDII